MRLEIVTAEDLNQYFKRFGEVTDVYIPRPSRSFAFVTFLESSIVPSLYGDHFINGYVRTHMLLLVSSTDSTLLSSVQM